MKVVIIAMFLSDFLLFGVLLGACNSNCDTPKLSDAQIIINISDSKIKAMLKDIYIYYTCDHERNIKNEPLIDKETHVSRLERRCTACSVLYNRSYEISKKIHKGRAYKIRRLRDYLVLLANIHADTPDSYGYLMPCWDYINHDLVEKTYFGDDIANFYALHILISFFINENDKHIFMLDSHVCSMSDMSFKEKLSILIQHRTDPVECNRVYREIIHHQHSLHEPCQCMCMIKHIIYSLGWERFIVFVHHIKERCICPMLNNDKNRCGFIIGFDKLLELITIVGLEQYAICRRLEHNPSSKNK